MSMEIVDCTFAIIGGGIAGVSCAKGLSFLAPEESTILITASPLVKLVTNIVPLSKTLMQFDVEERNMETLNNICTTLKVEHDVVVKIDTLHKLIETQNGKIIRFRKLCLCNGAKPKLIADDNFVIGIRDTESVAQFSQKIKNAKRIIVVGNGGIATEIVHEIDNVELIWVIKDKHISATFVDPGAAEFFQENIHKTHSLRTSNCDEPIKRMRYTISNNQSVEPGPSLGPDWHHNIDIKGNIPNSRQILIEYECEVNKIFSQDEYTESNDTEKWPVYVELTNGKIIGCDLVVSATGVLPNTNLKGLENLKKEKDGGFIVDWKLETSEKDIYAAGDVCTAGWQLTDHWFQMRLWTQAYQMGRYASKSMVCGLKGEEFLQDFCFELFTHVTMFFGYKVILLGLYNGQNLDGKYEILLRMTKQQEYIKLVLKNGKLQGAILIGDTGLEEMCENLILDQIDLSPFGEDILNPDIDIEDYFD